MSTITRAQQKAIATYLSTHELPKGLGSRERACSIAAINLALTGELTDTIPDCMSAVIGKWIIAVQDAMPAEMRNSKAWKHLLPLAAGTGREREQERLNILLAWMWETVLPSLQEIADEKGFGDPWRVMCTQKSAAAAWSAAAAAQSARSARSAESAAAAAAAATATAAAWSAQSARSVAWSAAEAATRSANQWEIFNPCAVLEKLIVAGE